MPKTLNIAVIGAGTMAQAVHLPVLRRRWDRFTVAALVDHSPRRRREASEVWGIAEDRRYETVADLVAAVRAKTITLDGAVLSTDGLHVEDLLQLMRRGIPVLVEPPLGYSAEEVAKVADFERMTGRRLVMMAYPQQYDDSVARMSELIATKDLRMIDHEVLMPASQPLFGGAHVTTSSYDLPSEVRSQRRKDLQAAVEAGAGAGATQRDRDLYVKGLLTGVAHQMAVIEAAYGPIARVRATRHWPKGVIPGSIELLAELDGGAQARLVWHYLPFAPEYSETVSVLSARRRMRLELPAPSHGDSRSSVSLREKKAGVVQETSTVATKGSAELMWEAFHAFVEKGKPPVSGAAEARNQVTLLREVLSSIVTADGRSLEVDPADEGEGTGDEGAAGLAAADGAAADEAGDAGAADAAEIAAVPAEASADTVDASADASAPAPPGAEGTAAHDAPAADGGEAFLSPTGDDAATSETLAAQPAQFSEQPVQDLGTAEENTHRAEATDEVADAWSAEHAPAAEPTAAQAEEPIVMPATPDDSRSGPGDTAR